MNIEKAESRLKDFAERYYDNNLVVRIFHLSDVLKQKNKDIYDEKMKYVKKNASSMGKMVGGTETGVRILEILNLVIGVYFVYQGRLSIGALIGIWNITIGTIAYSAADLPEMISGLSMQSVSLERLDEIAVLSREPDHAQHQPIRSYTCVMPALPTSQRTWYLFDHVNLSVSQGEKIVIEGESGKGKSTLMKVIAGLYAPTKGTILENIRMGNGCAGKQDIEEVAEKAGLHEWIESLPHSYDTHLDVLGKQNLSQGQMQRIAIARALLRKADLYLFDEITSALDPVTENKILDTIESMDGAVLLISHKENVLARFDRKIRI